MRKQFKDTRLTPGSRRRGAALLTASPRVGLFSVPMPGEPQVGLSVVLCHEVTRAHRALLQVQLSVQRARNLSLWVQSLNSELEATRSDNEKITLQSAQYPACNIESRAVCRGKGSGKPATVCQEAAKSQHLRNANCYYPANS